jgi:hypothetical protein
VSFTLVSTTQLNRIEATVNRIETKLSLVETEILNIMANITDIQTAQTAEKADLVTLTGFVTQLLAAFASGAMTPAQAQAVLDEINAEDSTVKTNIASIQKALPTPPPVPPPTPTV